jgi:hypothetical protein
MANRIQITIPTVQVLPMSGDPFEAVRVYDEKEKHYTDQQAVNNAGIPLWRARGQVIRLGGAGVQGNVELASRQEPHVESLKPFAVKDAVLTIWADRHSGELGVKVAAEVGE